MSKLIQPTSTFPFAPLTDADVEIRKSNQAGFLGLYSLRFERAPSDAVQRYADLVRSSDVRCGYERTGWPALDGAPRTEVSA